MKNGKELIKYLHLQPKLVNAIQSVFTDKSYEAPEVELDDGLSASASLVYMSTDYSYRAVIVRIFQKSTGEICEMFTISDTEWMGILVDLLNSPAKSKDCSEIDNLVMRDIPMPLAEAIWRCFKTDITEYASITNENGLTFNFEIHPCTTHSTKDKTVVIIAHVPSAANKYYALKLSKFCKMIDADC